MRSACFRHKRQADTKAAFLFYPPEAPERAIWIPRSVCTHRSMLERPADHEHPLTKITVEDWWVERNPHLDQYFS